MNRGFVDNEVGKSIVDYLEVRLAKNEIVIVEFQIEGNHMTIFGADNNFIIFEHDTISEARKFRKALKGICTEQ